MAQPLPPKPFATEAVPHVFGYGSLVNVATHDMQPTRPARLSGWRRIWVHTMALPVAVLSVHRTEGEIAGMLAPVAGGDWRALDARESGYARHPATEALRMDAGGPLPKEAMVYAVDMTPRHLADKHRPILLSYLDVVLQGFLRSFGETGVTQFAATTDGWEAAVLDDRAAPRYPRHQPLTAAERGIVDDLLSGLGCRMIRG